MGRITVTNFGSELGSRRTVRRHNHRTKWDRPDKRRVKGEETGE